MDIKINLPLAMLITFCCGVLWERSRHSAKITPFTPTSKTPKAQPNMAGIA